MVFEWSYLFSYHKYFFLVHMIVSDSSENIWTMVPHCRVFYFCILKTLVQHFNLLSNDGVFFVHFTFHHSRWKNSQGLRFLKLKLKKIFLEVYLISFSNYKVLPQHIVCIRGINPLPVKNTIPFFLPSPPH